MSIDRLERRLPEVLTELATLRVPDYVDDLLGRTERMSQRPGWTFLERWFPVSTITSALSPARRPSVRPLVVLAIIAALVAASVAIYVGTQRRLPPPFGPAANGVVITGNAAGDLLAVDPVTGEGRTIVAGPNLCCARISPDGQRFAFLRIDPATGDPAGLGVAEIDGAARRDLAPEHARFIEWLEWTPDGGRMLITNQAGVVVVDASSGQATPIDVPFTVLRASWIGTTDDILLTSPLADSGLRVLRLAAGASAPEELTVLRDALDPPLVSPDGTKFLYVTWGDGVAEEGLVHVFDLATRTEAEITGGDTPAANTWLNPVWSPDSSLIAAERYSVSGASVGILSAAGGRPTVVGPRFSAFTNGAAIRFSPDGRSLLVTYRFDGSTWLLPVDGSEGRQVTWAVVEEMDWQRLAP